MKAFDSAADREEGTAADGAMGVPEACKFTGLGRTFLYTLMDRGELTYTRVGKRRLIFRTALVALLKRGTVEPTVEGSVIGST